MADEASPPTAWLEDEQGGRFELGQTFSIGRSSGCSLRCDEARVSRKHASIHDHGGGEYWIADLGSANGTRVNGTRLSQPIRLRHGDRIEIGSHLLAFRSPGSAGADGSTQVTTQRTLIELLRQERWLVVADIENSTMLASSLEPEIYKQYVDEWFRKARALVEQRRGSVNKFLGDGFLACWPEGDGAAENVRVTLAGFEQMRAELPFSFRVAVHFGEVILGGIGMGGEESISGPEVNYVFRMEKLAGTNGISVLVSEVAARRLGGLLELPVRHNFAVAGFTGEHRFLST